jgi:hypothetical protein
MRLALFILLFPVFMPLAILMELMRPIWFNKPSKKRNPLIYIPIFIFLGPIYLILSAGFFWWTGLSQPAEKGGFSEEFKEILREFFAFFKP